MELDETQPGGIQPKDPHPNQGNEDPGQPLKP